MLVLHQNKTTSLKNDNIIFRLFKMHYYTFDYYKGLFLSALKCV